MSEARILRDRQVALAGALDRQAARAQPYGAGRIALQIYNGGMMASTGEKDFLGDPGNFTDNECEGCADPGSFDTSISIPVFILGSQAPSVGDILTAYAVGGRWVAETGGC